MTWTVTQSSSVPLGHLSSACRPIVSSRLFHRAGNLKHSFTYIGKAHQLLSSVSCRMSGRLFHKAGTLKEHLTFRQVQPSFLCGSCMSSSYNIRRSSPGKSSFLPKWLTNAIRSLFNAHLPLEVIGATRSRCNSLP